MYKDVTVVDIPTNNNQTQMICSFQSVSVCEKRQFKTKTTISQEMYISWQIRCKFGVIRDHRSYFYEGQFYLYLCMYPQDIRYYEYYDLDRLNHVYYVWNCVAGYVCVHNVCDYNILV